MIMVCKTWYNACLKQETYWTTQRTKVFDKLTSEIATNNYAAPESLYRLSQSSTGLKLFFETACLRQMSDIALFNWMANRENMWIVERLCSCFHELPYEDIACFLGSTKISDMPCKIQTSEDFFLLQTRWYLPQGNISDQVMMLYFVLVGGELFLYEQRQPKKWVKILLDTFFLPFEQWITK